MKSTTRAYLEHKELSIYSIPGDNLGFPDVSVCKESACNAGDAGDVDLIPGSGRFPGEGNGNQLQQVLPEKILQTESA